MSRGYLFPHDKQPKWLVQDLAQRGVRLAPFSGERTEPRRMPVKPPRPKVYRVARCSLCGMSGHNRRKHLNHQEVVNG